MLIAQCDFAPVYHVVMDYVVMEFTVEGWPQSSDLIGQWCVWTPLTYLSKVIWPLIWSVHWCSLLYYHCTGHSISRNLTHLLLVLHMCINKSGQYWFRSWLVAYLAPGHYLNERWVIVNWTLRNKFQWNFNQNTEIFIHENASENIICKMSAILSRGRWVNTTTNATRNMNPIDHGLLIPVSSQTTCW